MIQIFIVFHKRIFDDCYTTIPDDILNKYFTFVAVNKNIPKIYTPNKYKILNEWELPHYNHTLQERGYNENSVIYHIYANNLHKPYTHIGFFQYDMVFHENIIDTILKYNTTKNIYFAFQTYNFQYCSYTTWDELKTLHYIIRSYERFFKKIFSRDEKYPLWNSYVIPTSTYETIMPWVIHLYDKLYPWCVQPPNKTHFAHIGGIYERIMAYAIGQEKLTAMPLHISHDHSFKSLSY